MSRSLSLDVRERVSLAVQEGMSCRQASLRWARSRARPGGAAPRGGPGERRLNARQGGGLEARVGQRPAPLELRVGAGQRPINLTYSGAPSPPPASTHV
jgi:hypothetical protein